MVFDSNLHFKENALTLIFSHLFYSCTHKHTLEGRNNLFYVLLGWHTFSLSTVVQHVQQSKKEIQAFFQATK